MCGQEGEDEIKLTENLKFVLGRLENIVGKVENADKQHFLLFLQCFLKDFFFKVGIALKGVHNSVFYVHNHELHTCKYYYLHVIYIYWSVICYINNFY